MEATTKTFMAVVLRRMFRTITRTLINPSNHLAQKRAKVTLYTSKQSLCMHTTHKSSEFEGGDCDNQRLCTRNRKEAHSIIKTAFHITRRYANFASYQKPPHTLRKRASKKISSSRPILHNNLSENLLRIP